MNSNNKFASSSPPKDDIPVDLEEPEEYSHDDFTSSEGSGALGKVVNVSASGKLPPLSSSYPFGATEKSLSQSFKDSKGHDQTRNSSSVKKDGSLKLSARIRDE